MGECASTCSNLIEDDNKQLLLSFEQKKKLIQILLIITI